MKKAINDPIHGSIELDSKEIKIIDHPAFQRLRRVKALGFLDRVFPGAKHSRFEHSIGAAHVAGLLFDSIREISESLCSEKWSDSSEWSHLDEDSFKAIFSEENKKAIRIAALLHDIGHGPFSHASECVMPPLSQLIETNKDAWGFILKALEKSKKKKKKKGKGDDPQADHEDYSLLLVWKILKDCEFSEDDAQRVAALKSNLIDPPSSLDKNYAKVLSLLVDGEIDSDRMDYLLRDSHYCGVPYGVYNLKRLREGLCFVQKRKEISLAILRKSVTAFEHFLFSRFQMHVQIYTHKIDSSCNTAFKVIMKSSGDWTLPADISEYARIDDESLLVSKNDEDLKELILRRKLWKLAIQNYGGDETNDSALFDRFMNDLDESKREIYTSEKPFKKSELLDLPVVSRGLGRIFGTTKMRSSSQLIAHFNGTFQVKRLFYHPDLTQAVQLITKSILNDEPNLEKESKDNEQKISSMKKKSVRQKKAAGKG